MRFIALILLGVLVGIKPTTVRLRTRAGRPSSHESGRVARHAGPLSLFADENPSVTLDNNHKEISPLFKGLAGVIFLRKKEFI